jgi:hypothetical protein
MEDNTMTTPENPPAFPSPDSISGNNIVHGFYGMSLRDYFAGQASTALLMNPAYRDCGNEAAVADEVARMAGRVADAQLAEREKRKDAT